MSLELREGNIVLRAPTEQDIHPLTLLANNKNIWDNLRDYFPHPYTIHHAKDFIASVSAETPPLTFAVEYSNEFCGIIGLAPQTDVYRKSAEVGYWLGEPFWNKGIATTAVKLITQYALAELEYVRVHTGIFEYNQPSMRVLEKNGYVKEGVFRKSIFKNSKLWDEHRYAITR